MIPAITGLELIRLLQKDGWAIGRQATHGITLTKSAGGRTKVTLVPTIRASLPDGTLRAILSDKQTGLGKQGLIELLNKHGI